jgi:RNA polymerase sigma-B factor
VDDPVLTTRGGDRLSGLELRVRYFDTLETQRQLIHRLRDLRLSARHELDQMRAVSADVRAQVAGPRPGRLLRRNQPLRTAPHTDAGPDLLEMLTKYAYTRDPELRDALLAAYDGFAVTLARKFPSRREAPEDLAQVARIGLLHALDRFEPGRGRPFTTYARATILGELKRHIRDRTWSMRVPRSLQENYLAVVRVVDELTQTLGRSPSIPEIAERAGLSEDNVLEAMELGSAQRPLSFEIPSIDPDSRAIDPGMDEPAFRSVDTRALLGVLLARLPERDRRILGLRFVDQLTQAEIAERMGVSQMYISRLLARTLARMRAWAGDG